MTDFRFFLLLLSALLAGCFGATTVPVAPLAPPAPAEQWQQGSGEEAAVTPVPWLQSFGDPTLDRLVREAMAANPTLIEAEARLREGEAAAVVAGAPLSPALDLGAQAGRNRRNGISADNYSAELSLSWEWDLWDRLSAAAQAAAVDRDALAQDLRAARLSLAANVAKGWFAAVEALEQQRLSERLVDNLTQSLQVLEEGYRAGLVDALDIHLARANLASEQSRLADRRRLLGDRLRELELLLGRYPARALLVPARLPELPAAVPAGLPAQLLARRPDIRAAEARLRSAGLLQQARHADRLPRLSLSGALGGSSDELSELLRSDNLLWSLFGSVAQPLLDGGRLEGLERQAAAQREQVQARYVDSLLTAFAEVEGALEQERELRQLVRALAVSVRESDLAETLAYEQYRQGLVDIITALEAQRRAFNARSTYTEARNRQLQNRINLYLALGGDYAAPSPQAQAQRQGEDG